MVEMNVATVPRSVRLVDAAPELFAELDANARALARRHAVASVVELPPGRWSSPPDIQRAPGHLGLLILDGFMVRDVHLDETIASELVGPGDLLRPIDYDGDEAPVPFDVDWNVLAPTRLAVLDRNVAAVLGHWPELVEALVRRGIRRAHSLGVHLAVCHMRRVEPRLLVLMWHLADRWGKVTADGVHVPLRLTHQTLAGLVGAQRPTVTMALKSLAARDLVVRRNDGSWLLHGDPPDALEQIRARPKARCGEQRAS